MSQDNLHDVVSAGTVSSQPLRRPYTSPTVEVLGEWNALTLVGSASFDPSESLFLPFLKVVKG